MWNGIGIVRVAGSPHILEVIINEQASNETTSCGTSQVDDEDKEHPQYSRINYLMPAPGPGIELGLLGSLMARTVSFHGSAIPGSILTAKSWKSGTSG